MEILQTGFFNQTKSKPPAVKEESGFVTVCLLCFLSLMLTAVMAFSVLSLGIKNITRSQTYCIEQTL